MFFEAQNIANGNSAPSFGIEVQLGLHSGYYKCLGRNLVQLTDIGYIYKTDAVPVLRSNGAIATHTYHLTFSRDFKTCTGNLSFLFFTTGSNPFKRHNVPILVGSMATVTGELLDGRNYKWPSD
ncbi:unnamed protein product [Rotaria sp. Silwood2]|nr:unnamed protein product [Rotaria sp. Silwood2]CAF3090909.1 unnamed protein product [Rotaria sp. Silwood2]CAF4222502.1 unnamed protein product [Rotaria sp. Silwood2]